MFIKRGKPIDSARLKRSINKSDSCAKAAAFSRSIAGGQRLSSCPICEEHRSNSVATIYGFEYVECLGCGTAYVANPPSEEALRDAYRSDYYTAANKALLANDEIIDYRVKNIAEPKIDFSLQHIGATERTWLDIGCGVGEILAAVKRRDYKAVGLEANPMEAKYARSKFGVDVREEYVTDLSGRYGVVSLFSVLEHVLSPNTLLAQVAGLQRPGDSLVIEVPHYPSLSVASQVAFPEQVNRMMHPPLHLFLFPLTSLEMMLRKHGYTIKAAWFFGQDFYEMFTTLGMFTSIPNKLRDVVAALSNDFQRVIDDHGLSDEVLVVATKSH